MATVEVLLRRFPAMKMFRSLVQLVLMNSLVKSRSHGSPRCQRAVTPEEGVSHPGFIGWTDWFCGIAPIVLLDLFLAMAPRGRDTAAGCLETASAAAS